MTLPTIKHGTKYPQQKTSLLGSASHYVKHMRSISGLYFPIFGLNTNLTFELNTKIYGVNLRIQSEEGNRTLFAECHLLKSYNA